MEFDVNCQHKLVHDQMGHPVVCTVVHLGTVPQLGMPERFPILQHHKAHDPCTYITLHFRYISVKYAFCPKCIAHI